MNIPIEYIVVFTTGFVLGVALTYALITGAMKSSHNNLIYKNS